VLLVAFCLLSIFLVFQQHAAFRTNLYDLGSYTHRVWNLARGAGFTTSIGPTNFLSGHFMPLLALVAPTFWIWADPRMLMIVQSIGLMLTIVPGYLILRQRFPRLAPVLVLAFVFSPLLHSTAATEFHGIMLAAPFMAWAFYALYMRRTRLLLIALAFAILAREDMGLYVACFGLFIVIARKGQRWLGVALTVFGGAWVFVMINWVMPSFGHAYHHFNAYSAIGGRSLPEMISNVIRNPLRVVNIIFTPSKINALFKFIWPLAGLPIVALGYAVLWLPVVGVYLLSNAAGSGLLNSWRVAPFLPLLWGSIAALLVRLQLRWAIGGLLLLVLSTTIGYLTLSPYPGGGRYNPALYQVDQHNLLGEQVVASIPPDASVGAQDGLAAHLSTRQQIRLFPLYSEENTPELIVVDEKAPDFYPQTADEFHSLLLSMQLDPKLDIVREQDGYFVFRTTGVANQSMQPVSVTYSSTLNLYGFEVAQSDGSTPFDSLKGTIGNGGSLRVSLYWTALQAMSDHLSISVRLIDSAGNDIVQDDSWPGRGSLPTPLWDVGRSIRDVHYLDLTDITLPPQVSVVVAVYDAATLQRLTPIDGYTLATFQTK
jgi:uncharacterized membrane protein